MSERSETAPSQFTDVQHVHCRICGEAIAVVDTFDPVLGYYDGSNIAQHTCRPRPSHLNA